MFLGYRGRFRSARSYRYKGGMVVILTSRPTRCLFRYNRPCRNGCTGFDDAAISYRSLKSSSLHNPTEINRQGPDVGTQYRSVIFYTTPEQEMEAKQYIDQLNKSGRYSAPIASEVVKASVFWPAEDCHQSYFLKMGQRYGGLL